MSGRRVLGIACLTSLWLAACAGGAPKPTEPENYLPWSSFEMPGRETVLLRWPKRKMPLTVYLPPPPEDDFEDPAAVLAAVRAGILAWEGLAGPGLPTFEFVDRPGDADIPIAWAAVPDGDWYIAHCVYDIQPFARRFGVTRILITARWGSGRAATPEETRAVVTHEMGHALGLGHSPHRVDIMYESYEPDVVDPSFRDENTLRMLYESPIGRRIRRPRRVEVEEEPESAAATLAPDAWLAVAEPCRYMGTVHRRGRHQLDVLWKRERIDKTEWACAAKALAAVDAGFTDRCDTEPVLFETIQSELRQHYEACFGADGSSKVEFAIDFSQFM